MCIMGKSLMQLRQVVRLIVLESIDFDALHLSSDGLYHASPEPISSIRPVTSQPKRGKPNGFWYAVGSEWIDWSRESLPGKIEDVQYVYEVNISSYATIDSPSPFSVLRLTLKDIRSFEKKYGIKMAPLRGFAKIDWDKVAADYAGIEIPFSGISPEAHMWYYGWDIPSGCVWNPSVVSSFVEVGPAA